MSFLIFLFQINSIYIIMCTCILGNHSLVKVTCTWKKAVSYILCVFDKVLGLP